MTETKTKIGPARAGIEAALIWGGRETVAPALKWLAAGLALSLPLLPMLGTTYIGFLYTAGIAFWLRARGEPWSAFGLKRPASWTRVALVALATILACILFSTIAEPALKQLLGVNKAKQFFGEMEGNIGLFLAVLPMVWLFAALGEEFLYRGVIMTRLEQAFGGWRWGWIPAVFGQAALFGLGHFYQGWSGVVSVGFYGLFYGLAVRACRGNLAAAMLAHGILDTIGFTLLYLGAF